MVAELYRECQEGMGLGVKTNQRAVMISCAVWTGTSRVLNTDHFQASVEIKLPFCSSFGSPQCWINVCHEDEKFPSKSRTYSKAILLFSFWLIHCWRLFESCIVNYFFWLNVFLILWRKLKFFFFFWWGRSTSHALELPNIILWLRN